MTGKSQEITDFAALLQARHGAANIVVNDHWKSDAEAIGLSDNTGRYLALEDPPVDDALPYSPAGEFNQLTFDELERIVTTHLRLSKSTT